MPAKTKLTITLPAGIELEILTVPLANDTPERIPGVNPPIDGPYTESNPKKWRWNAAGCGTADAIC